MKHVVTIKELQKLIPETKKLEGTSYKDLQSLLISIITEIEASGNWEFIQYIAGNPSLFIVKKKEPIYINERNLSNKNYYDSMEKEIDNHYNNVPISPIKEKIKKDISQEKVETESQLDKSQSNNSDSKSSSSLFNEINLPW